MITAKSNSQLKQLSALLRKRSLREEENAFVIEGRKMFFELSEQAPELIVKSYWAESALQSLTAEERAAVEACPYEVVSDDAFRSVSETVTPQGVLAIVRKKTVAVSELTGSGMPLLVLETLQDPGNLGTILRTAEAAGFGILLSADSVDVYSPKVVRATMGAIRRVPFCYTDDLRATLTELKKAGYTLYAAHLSGSVPYDEPGYEGCCAVLIGNEGNGLSKETTELSDVRVRIPMEGNAESLNAAVAAALLMYEVKRNR